MTVVTQNGDDFHERAVSSKVMKEAVRSIREADLMIIGCSLKVFPAARMIEDLREEAQLVFCNI